MATADAITIHNLWEQPSDDIERGVLELWSDHEALPHGADPRRRLAGALLAAIDRHGQAVAVCTAFKRYHQPLDNHMWFYRSFVAPPFRRQGIATRLLIEARDYLESSADRDREVIGILLEVTSDPLKQRTEAVWPTTKFTFVGRNQRGAHIRIYYFGGVHLVQDRSRA